MKDLSATEAARRFSEVLDAVEHRHETFIVTRNGKPVARIAPASTANGKRVKEIFLAHTPDPEWAGELRELRAMLTPEERPWPD